MLADAAASCGTATCFAPPLCTSTRYCPRATTIRTAPDDDSTRTDETVAVRRSTAPEPVAISVRGPPSRSPLTAPEPVFTATSPDTSESWTAPDPEPIRTGPPIPATSTPPDPVSPVTAVLRGTDTS